MAKKGDAGKNLEPQAVGEGTVIVPKFSNKKHKNTHLKEQMLIEHTLKLGRKLFLRPTQGIIGIRRAGSPVRSSAGGEVVRIVNSNFGATGIASKCLGKKGTEFYNCLREVSKSLKYAGNKKSAFWYAIEVLLENGQKDKAQEAINARFITGYNNGVRVTRYPDSAFSNGRRIVHSVISGEVEVKGKEPKVLAKELLDKVIEVPYLFSVCYMEEYENVKNEFTSNGYEKLKNLINAWSNAIVEYASTFARVVMGMIEDNMTKSGRPIVFEVDEATKQVAKGLVDYLTENGEALATEIANNVFSVVATCATKAGGESEKKAMFEL